MASQTLSPLAIWKEAAMQANQNPQNIHAIYTLPRQARISYRSLTAISLIRVISFRIKVN